MQESQTVPRVKVVHYPVTGYMLDEAARWCLQAVRTPKPKLLVTLNPEIVVQAETNPALRDALEQADLHVADGVGVVWAARRAGAYLPERVPGVELLARVLELGGADLRVFFLGAKPGVAARAAQVARERYGTTVAGVHHGYFRRPDETPRVTALIGSSNANLLVAGLGEGQELFLHQHRHAMNVPLMIGVGGSLDVLAGEVKRTPAWTRRLGIEWAYRVGLDRKRWHRFPRLLRFMQLVLAQRTEKG
jgi:N-acetylglucosaminyldiphosphoundecaprenol N-acetyl-beta-D-mannosaminyltransferase